MVVQPTKDWRTRVGIMLLRENETAGRGSIHHARLAPTVKKATRRA
jgi:hypothetical protein